MVECNGVTLGNSSWGVSCILEIDKKCKFPVKT